VCSFIFRTVRQEKGVFSLYINLYFFHEWGHVMGKLACSLFKLDLPSFSSCKTYFLLFSFPVFVLNYLYSNAANGTEQIAKAKIGTLPFIYCMHECVTTSFICMSLIHTHSPEKNCRQNCGLNRPHFVFVPSLLILIHLNVRPSVWKRVLYVMVPPCIWNSLIRERKMLSGFERKIATYRF
jgi:hypothetical protein